MKARSLGFRTGLKTRLAMVTMVSVVMFGGDAARGQAPRPTPALYDALGASGAKPAALKPVRPLPAPR